MDIRVEFSKLWDRIKGIFDLHGEIDVDSAMRSIVKNIDFKGMNVWILACAIVIASLGLNVNSTAVIIGAMLISPLMGPIIGMGLSVGTYDLQLMKISLMNLGKMVAISVAASTLFFLLSPLNMQHPSELLARTNPTIYDVLIAFVGGFAGALEICRKEKGTVISGVAIATALMPPLCTVGYGISTLSLNIAMGAFYLFFINCVFVAMATFLVVKFVGFPPKRHVNAAVEMRARSLASVLMLVFVVPSVFSAITVVRENNFNSKVDDFVSTVQKTLPESVIYDYKTDTQNKPYSVTLYVAGRRLSDVDKETLYRAAEKEYNLGRHQIILEAALSMTDSGELEKQVYADLLDKVRQQKQQLDQYESQILPYEQISSEVMALYPQVSGFSLARGQKDIFAIVESKADSLSTDGLESWLKVRLQSDDVVILRKQAE